MVSTIFLLNLGDNPNRLFNLPFDALVAALAADDANKLGFDLDKFLLE